MKIGMLIARSGPAGLWAPSCDACGMLAAAELNAAGGIQGRPVELLLADAGTSERAADAAAAMLVDIEDVDAIVGMHPSSVRAAIKRRIGGRIPYIYTPQYEGGERGRNVVAIGGTDTAILMPAIPWFIEHRHAGRFFLIGNDYVWPRMASVTAARIIADAGGRVVGDATIPFGVEDFSDVLQLVAQVRPDVVVTFLLGEEAVRFNRAFAAAGLGARMLRLGMAVDETVLYAIGADNAENLYVAITYLANIASRRNDRFRELYHQSFGEAAPPANTFAQSCYDGIHLLARQLEGGRGCDAAAPWRHPVHVAEADGIDFRLLATH